MKKLLLSLVFLTTFGLNSWAVACAALDRCYHPHDYPHVPHEPHSDSLPSPHHRYCHWRHGHRYCHGK